MDASFHKEFLAKELAKLNSTQRSIWRLSQWCLLHRHYSRQIVEAWDCEFRTASCGKKVSLFYLANDIMQNTRKESSGYITEFMRSIPAALNEVFKNGDDSGRKVVKRLVDIWEDRNIFDNQGQSVNDDFRKLKDLINKLTKHGELLEKVVSKYKGVLDATKDEDIFLRKCQTSLGLFDNLNKVYENDTSLGSTNKSRFVEELKEQDSNIGNSIEKLKTSESLRATLISHLKEALHEQELKVAQIRSQLEAAQPRYKKANELYQKLVIDVEGHQPSNKGLKRHRFSEIMPVTRAANVVTKFAASVASEEMLTGVLSSQANAKKEVEHHSYAGHKRQKTEDDTRSELQQPAPPPYPPPSPPPPPSCPPPSPPPPPPAAAAALNPQQMISWVTHIADPFVPFSIRPPSLMTGMPYGTFPPRSHAFTSPMTNMCPPDFFPGAPLNPPPAFHGSGGMF